MIKSLVTGLLCGMVFSLVRLPIPAPSTWEGIAGILGIFVGYAIMKQIQ